MEWKLNQKSISFNNKEYGYQDSLITILLTLKELGGYILVSWEMTEEG